MNQIFKNKSTFSFFLIILGFAVSYETNAQDPIFTQFVNSPLQINPAFTGNTYAPLFHINSRLEWTNVNFAYKTLSASYDQFFIKNNFGSGLLINMDDSGQGIYKRFRAEASFSYRLKAAENNYFKFGLSAAYGQNSLDWDKLVFGDQLDPKFGVQLPDGTTITTEENRPDNLTRAYLDLSAGILFYSPVFYIGASIKHANTPTDYYFGKSDKNTTVGLPVRFAFDVGGEFHLKKLNYSQFLNYSPHLIYILQSNLMQLTLHNYLKYNSVLASIGYRYNVVNSDAILFLLGMEKDIFTICYSYDLTISQLTPSTGGTHEIGIKINLEKSDRYNKPFKYSDCFGMFR